MGHLNRISRIFISTSRTLLPLAYAGFSKGRGEGNLRIMKTKRKISPLRINRFSGPKLGEDQKKGGFSPRFCLFVCSNFLPKLQWGGGHVAILHYILC